MKNLDGIIDTHQGEVLKNKQVDPAQTVSILEAVVPRYERKGLTNLSRRAYCRLERCRIILEQYLGTEVSPDVIFHFVCDMVLGQEEKRKECGYFFHVWDIFPTEEMGEFVFGHFRLREGIEERIDVLYNFLECKLGEEARRIELKRKWINKGLRERMAFYKLPDKSLL